MEKTVFVYYKEMYYGHESGDGIVGVTMMGVLNRQSLASDAAMKDAEWYLGRYGATLKEYGRGTNEHRIWGENPSSPHMDKFVWVVREVKLNPKL